MFGRPVSSRLRPRLFEMVRILLAAALVVGVSAIPDHAIYGRAVNATSATAPASQTTSASLVSSSISSAATASTTTDVTTISVSSATTSAIASGSSMATTSTSGTITPVPTGVLPDEYFVKGNTPRTWSQALALASKFVAPMTVQEKGEHHNFKICCEL